MRDAFSRGTIQVQITISGLPEDAALQNAKKLAARIHLQGSDEPPSER
jgi:hypothetical protein